MYKIIFVFLAIMGIATASCAQQKQGANRKQPNNKVLIAYFSATGTTAGAAEKNNCQPSNRQLDLWLSTRAAPRNQRLRRCRLGRLQQKRSWLLWLDQRKANSGI